MTKIIKLQAPWSHVTLGVILTILCACAVLISGCGPTRRDTTLTVEQQKLLEQTSYAPGSLTLKEVLDNAPAISLHKPSLFVARMAGNIVRIQGQEYEIRYFFFEQARPFVSSDITFGEFARKYDLLSTKSKISKLRGIPFEFFREPDDLAEKGVFYMLSLRKVSTLPPYVSY